MRDSDWTRAWYSTATNTNTCNQLKTDYFLTGGEVDTPCTVETTIDRAKAVNHFSPLLYLRTISYLNDMFCERICELCLAVI